MVFKRKLSDEVVAFILNNVSKMTPYKVRKELIKRFDIVVSKGACEYYYKRYIKNEHVMRGKLTPTFLTKPIGTERTDGDGYIRVLIGSGKEKLKHHIVWEKDNTPLKNDEILIFLDGDRTNCSIDNLVLVKRKYIPKINNILKDIDSVTPEMRKTAILTAKLFIDASERELKSKRNSPNRNPKKQDYKDIVFLHKQGLTANEIAKILNKSKSAIYWTLHRWRLGCYEGY